MGKFIINVLIHILRLINLIFKPCRIEEKVTIISRQANEPTLDIKMLNECLINNGIKTVVLTKTLDKNIIGILRYFLHMIIQMYHIATSKVIVLDGYCILVSILPKKREQSVVQMWHALGAIKKFGWQNTDNIDGNGAEIAELMRMHENYDYVFAPSIITGTHFSEAFRVKSNQLVMLGLPRIDFLMDDNKSFRKSIENKYPIINEKINVLYAPTFRKNAVIEIERLLQTFNFNKFNLIIKKHFLDKGDYSWAEAAGAIVDSDFSSMEWLKICENVITDYSALAFEAAVSSKNLYIYQPDSKEYEHKVGLNIKLEDEPIGKYVCKTEKDLHDKLEAIYDKQAVLDFKEKYLEIDINNCTQKIVEFISDLLK